MAVLLIMLAIRNKHGLIDFYRVLPGHLEVAEMDVAHYRIAEGSTLDSFSAVIQQI